MIPKKVGLAAFDFEHGSVLFTEASPKKRASLYLVRGRAGLAEHDRGGLDLFAASTADFAAVLRSERHTIKRALTDPTLIDGVGNAYSDEILHVAKMSPFKPAAMSDEEIDRLYDALESTLREALARADGLAASELKGEKKSGMRVHGRTGQPCPVCGDTIRQVIFHDSTLQYCPTCQTGGKPLADRVLSRLLK